MLSGQQSQLLEGRVAVVTGAGRSGEPGVGSTIAAMLGIHGARVVVVDLNRAASEATVAEMAGNGSESIAVQADVTNEDDCGRIMAAAREAFGGANVLVNSVGISGGGDESLSAWNNVFAVNVTATMLMARTFVGQLSAGGVIVNISSTSAFRPSAAGGSAYPASKAAAVGLTQSLAVRYGPIGVRSNCICPGAAWTPMATRALFEAGLSADQLAEVRQERRDATLLKIEGCASDVAGAALYLASDLSSWVTGQTIVVDGGATLAPPTTRRRAEGTN